MVEQYMVEQYTSKEQYMQSQRYLNLPLDRRRYIDSLFEEGDETDVITGINIGIMVLADEEVMGQMRFLEFLANSIPYETTTEPSPN